MSFFFKDHRQAKVDLAAALDRAEWTMSTNELALDLLATEIDVFVGDVGGDLDGGRFASQVMLLFRASGYKAARPKQLVAVISDFSPRPWLAFLLFPLTFTLRIIAAVVRVGTVR